MKISYDREKDLYGPAYRLVYTGEDEYLKSENENVSKHIFLWTRSVRELVSLANLKKGEDGQESDHWIYDARKVSKEGFEETNAVSYTHLDVYKRQACAVQIFAAKPEARGQRRR